MKRKHTHTHTHTHTTSTITSLSSALSSNMYKWYVSCSNCYLEHIYLYVCHCQSDWCADNLFYTTVVLVIPGLLITHIMHKRLELPFSLHRLRIWMQVRNCYNYDVIHGIHNERDAKALNTTLLHRNNYLTQLASNWKSVVFFFVAEYKLSIKCSITD